ncbi:MAG: aspartate--tRNA(Asn) ligase [Candidatus Thermoplasmatota archaeon]|jgi:aspartyl-tRNA synthetase|nr:aspartate--tRNA(Asn) ligase [Candidatus Thermoplasmatota archaeon]MCL5794249.1 aspartate--tRNA(Asn) ligase [Candidatus Thermoplasmatota archaeon]
MKRTLISELDNDHLGKTVTVEGWIHEIKRLKSVDFIMLRDKTGIVQVTVKKTETPIGIDLGSLTRESVMRVTGEFPEKQISKKMKEITASKIDLLNVAATPLPLPVAENIESDLETRLNNRFLDLRRHENYAIFHTKSNLLWGIRSFLHTHGFVEVNTPKIVASSTEGGADLFRVQYFEMDAYLNQSPQLYKEILISSGFERVFEVGPAFRAEKHNTTYHLNEFTSIDIEMGFSNHEDAMAMLEGSVKSGIENALSHAHNSGNYQLRMLEVPELPFPRVEYSKCLSMVQNAGGKIEFGEDFGPEHLRVIGEKYPGFYFITKWPSELRPFYTMVDPDDETLTNSFDLQFREREITSGAQRVHDPEMLRRRFVAKGLNPEDFQFYLNAFRYGMPPHAGWGLGLERLAMILLDLKNIRETSLFPRDRTRIVP